ncbi:FimV/HubP family polar landmark protein [Aeromonas cavernicola]|uniref:Pilus assembly protein FimV n=1 Tax=Aeromonas cavernicola TaxID=1006623 RepID=A0A2H9U859_9GAMM|nr:FimV/HubP family polar landmark protein [Aeromonas cavernicola]PJG60188.1 pilus assembly protein FimV [Aeromonas cavernicola]
MGHSRITVAILLALGLQGGALAQQSAREPFYVELKGPDEPTPATVSAPPPAPPVARPLRATAQPVARKAAPARARSYGPVRSTDTLWGLASKHRPSNRVSVYQTMVAIYEKNPRSFADGNINHILVGSRILLPTTAEANVITDAQARQRFNQDNASWKGLSPKYLADKQTTKATPVTTLPPAVPATPAPATTAVQPTPSETYPAPIPKPAEVAPVAVSGVKDAAGKEAAEKVIPVAVPATVSSASSTAPAPLPSELDKPVGKPATELALALEDANAQLGQVTEMNHRLKLRLQALTEEIETLKAQLQDQDMLQKELAELKANPTPPVAEAPAAKSSWWMELLSSPLNLAMIILLPVLLVLALVTLWLRARARRELEEQELSLSESTAMVMERDHNEFDQLLSVDVTDEQSMATMPEFYESDDAKLMAAPLDTEVNENEVDLVVSADEPDTAESLPLDSRHESAPDVVPEVASADTDVNADLVSEEALQAALFAELEPELASTDTSETADLVSEEALQAALFAELEPELASTDTPVNADLVSEEAQQAALFAELEPESTDTPVNADLVSEEALQAALFAELAPEPTSADIDINEEALANEEAEQAALFAELVPDLTRADTDINEEKLVNEEAEQAALLAESTPESAGVEIDVNEDVLANEEPEPSLAELAPDLTSAQTHVNAAVPVNEEAKLTALFAKSAADVEPSTDAISLIDELTDEALATVDLSEFEQPFDSQSDAVVDLAAGRHVDEMLAELDLLPSEEPSKNVPEWDPNELALADFENAFSESGSHSVNLEPRSQAQNNDYVDIESLLAEADAAAGEDSYTHLTSDEQARSNGFDGDDGGVGAKLDLARAYLEIDDKESARELLEEAAAEGAGQQRAEATRLLKQLG